MAEPVLLIGIKKLAEELIGLAFKKIERVEAYKKMRRRFWGEARPNNFEDIYSRTLVELWYRGENGNGILLFKEEEIIHAFYDCWYKKLPEPEWIGAVQQQFEGLKIGDDLRAQGVPVEEVIENFIQEFDNQVTYSAPVHSIRLETALSKVSEAAQQSLEKRVAERNKALFEKFENATSTITEADVIRALCSDDIKLRMYGAYNCSRLEFVGAASLLLENLDSHDESLLKMTIQAVGDLVIREAADQLIKLFDHPSLQVAAMAKSVYFNRLKELDQSSFEQWLKWFHQNDETLKISVVSEIYRLAGKGMVDIESIVEDLLQEINNPDQGVREYIYRILFHREGVSRMIDFEAKINEEAQIPINVLCIARILIAEGNPEPVGRFLLEKLDTDPLCVFNYTKIAELCKSLADTVCQKAYFAFIETPDGEPMIKFGLFEPLYKRVPPKENALRKGHLFKERKLLNENKELRFFLQFIRNKQSFVSDRRMGFALTVDDQNSIYTLDGVKQFLEEESRYFSLDFREKTELQVNILLRDVSKSKMLCFIVPETFPYYVENVLYDLYDNSYVQTIDRSEKPVTIELGREVSFLVLTTKQTYEALRSNNNFERFIFAMPFDLSNQPTIYAELMSKS